MAVIQELAARGPAIPLAIFSTHFRFQLMALIQELAVEGPATPLAIFSIHFQQVSAHGNRTGAGC
jgi:hypothetical protein